MLLSTSTYPASQAFVEIITKCEFVNHTNYTLYCLQIPFETQMLLKKGSEASERV